MLQQLATPGGGASFFDSRNKAFFILQMLQHPVHRFLDYLLGVLAGAAGDFLEARLLVRTETYFHAASVRAFLGGVKRLA